MSSILNAFRSAPATPARHFTSLNISSASSVKSAFHPEHHPIVLQQLVESLAPKVSDTATSSAASIIARQSLSSAKSVKA
ncbi:hypothetical protein EDD11_006524 [Mortierella claussenii]|nr:hypothetical protein EDD11_006524 [Mortierella claussenii]